MSLISVDQAAQALGVSARRVRALIGVNQLPAIRVGRTWALDQIWLRSYVRRRAGRPVSADNAWALLAQLSGSEAPWIDLFSRSRLKRRVMRPEWLEKALRWSEPRAAVHSWRVLASDLQKFQDFGLVRSGLAARIPELDIVSIDNAVDGYVSLNALARIEKRIQPEKSSDNPNVVLRIPSQPWVLSKAPEAPPAVVAADLLVHPDGRVARAGRKLLHRVAASS